MDWTARFTGLLVLVTFGLVLVTGGLVLGGMAPTTGCSHLATRIR